MRCTRQCIQCQLELPDLRSQLLRRTTEPTAAQLRQLDLQTIDLDNKRPYQCLQGMNIIG